MPKFPHYLQPDAMDCGPTCLRIVAKHFGRHYNLETLRELTWKTREGVSLLTISDAAEKIGFRTQGVRLTYEKLLEVPVPVILHWNQSHFVVLYKIKKAKSFFSSSSSFGGGRAEAVSLSLIHISEPT